MFDGEEVTLIRNNQGSVLTPSVVRIDARGNVIVGTRARRFLDSDPANTRSEFKRLMGTTHALEFPASGTSRRPEELSAEVLKSLRQDVADQLGVAPERAVVSVPALFELHQTIDAPRTFSRWGVARNDSGRLTELTMKERRGNLDLNPVPFGERDVARLLDYVLE